MIYVMSYDLREVDPEPETFLSYELRLKCIRILKWERSKNGLFINIAVIINRIYYFTVSKL